MDWRNWAIGILIGWVSASFAVGRWSYRRESSEVQLTRRIEMLENDMREMRGLRYAVDQLREASNVMGSNVTSKLQVLIGEVSELTKQAVKLETWVCDLREKK